MIQYIEKGVDAIRTELIKEKIANEDYQKQMVIFQTQNGQLQTSNGQLAQKVKIANMRIEESQNRLILSQKELQSLKASETSELNKIQTKEQILQQQNYDLLQKLEKLKLQPQNNQEDSKSQTNLLKSQLQSQQQQMEALKAQISSNQDKFHQESKDKEGIQAKMIKKLKEFEIKEQTSMKETELLQQQIQKLLQELSKVKQLDQNSIDNRSVQEQYQQEIQNLKADLQKQISIHEKESEQIKQQQDSQNKLKEKLVSLKEQNEQKLVEKNKQIEQIQAGSKTQDQIVIQLQGDLSKMTSSVESLKKQMQEQIAKQSQKQTSLLNDNIQALEKSEKEMVNNLKCTYCKNFVKQPVTVIPCGHSYCLDCKKGYGKECSKCGPKLKVEAIYRNELLEDIINMVKIIQGSINTMKQLGRNSASQI